MRCCDEDQSVVPAPWIELRDALQAAVNVRSATAVRLQIAESLRRCVRERGRLTELLEHHTSSALHHRRAVQSSLLSSCAAVAARWLQHCSSHFRTNYANATGRSAHASSELPNFARVLPRVRSLSVVDALNETHIRHARQIAVHAS